MQAHEVLDEAYRLGIRYIDCARSYGLSEEFVAHGCKTAHRDCGRGVVGSKWGYECAEIALRFKSELSRLAFRALACHFLVRTSWTSMQRFRSLATRSMQSEAIASLNVLLAHFADTAGWRINVDDGEAHEVKKHTVAQHERQLDDACHSRRQAQPLPDPFGHRGERRSRGAGGARGPRQAPVTRGWRRRVGLASASQAARAGDGSHCGRCTPLCVRAGHVQPARPVRRPFPRGGSKGASSLSSRRGLQTAG